MNGAELLARLVAQGEGRGADLVTLRAMIEEASELGAGRALCRLGLDDEHAARDMAELRELLGAWRDAKASARHALIGWGGADGAGADGAGAGDQGRSL